MKLGNRLVAWTNERLGWLIAGVIVAIALTFAIATWLHFESAELRGEAVQASLGRQAQRVSNRFDSFFEPALLDLLVLQDMGQRGILRMDKPYELSNIILPILSKYPRKLGGFNGMQEPLQVPLDYVNHQLVTAN